MEEGATYVGMDVQKRTIAVSIRYPGGGRDERTIPHEAEAVNRLFGSGSARVNRQKKLRFRQCPIRGIPLS